MISSHCLEAAIKAAAQINAQLVAEGKLQQQRLDSGQLAPAQKQPNEGKAKPSKKDLFSAEVKINDLPPRVRNLLTKGYIQEQIQWRCSKLFVVKIQPLSISSNIFSMFQKLHFVPKEDTSLPKKMVEWMGKTGLCIFAFRLWKNKL